MSNIYESPMFQKCPALASLVSTQEPKPEHVRACLMELARVVSSLERQSSETSETLEDRIRKLIGHWRGISNVMSEADGDGPYRDTLRNCAKELENLLKK